MRRWYDIIARVGGIVDYRIVPDPYVLQYRTKGLKKGDAVIGGFCEWHHVEVLISENRHFLRELTTDHAFTIMNPSEFCRVFGLTDK